MFNIFDGLSPYPRRGILKENLVCINSMIIQPKYCLVKFFDTE